MSSKLFDVAGKTVLITGASRGIGKALAEAFRDAGAVVYGAGSREESVSWMADAQIRPCVIDVTRPNMAREVIDDIRAEHGRLDCLINNAGISSNTPASAFKEEEMERIIDTNFKGVFRACQAYYRAQKRDGGVIINVSSALGLVGYMLASVYSGTKGAVISLTKSLSLEWSGSNFRVNAICPGFVETDMTAGMTKNKSVMDQVTAFVPMKRIGKPEEVAGAAIYLASEGASYVTGQIIVVDGGMTAV